MKLQAIFKNKRFQSMVEFLVLYLAVFFFLEQRGGEVHMLDTPLDHMLPFCEYFIIPYLLWFPFIAATVLYIGLCVEEDGEFRKLIGMLTIGLVVFLLISFLYPNGQNLRPEINGGNIFKRLVGVIYAIDTPTNIFPSLHVYNAVACCIAVCKNSTLRARRGMRAGTIILTVFIILSTMLLKQHSILDVVAALGLNLISYSLYYGRKALCEAV